MPGLCEALLDPVQRALMPATQLQGLCMGGLRLLQRLWKLDSVCLLL